MVSWHSGGDVFGAASLLLGATRSIAVVTGILNIWKHTPQDVAKAHSELRRVYPNRFFLGLGSSHASMVDTHIPGSRRYSRPLTEMVSFLDELDAASPAVPKGERLLGALARE